MRLIGIGREKPECPTINCARHGILMSPQGSAHIYVSSMTFEAADHILHLHIWVAIGQRCPEPNTPRSLRFLPNIHLAAQDFTPIRLLTGESGAAPRISGVYLPDFVKIETLDMSAVPPSLMPMHPPWRLSAPRLPTGCVHRSHS
jgi:hypothetical protein